MICFFSGVIQSIANSLSLSPSYAVCLFQKLLRNSSNIEPPVVSFFPRSIKPVLKIDIVFIRSSSLTLVLRWVRCLKALMLTSSLIFFILRSYSVYSFTLAYFFDLLFCSINFFLRLCLCFQVLFVSRFVSSQFCPTVSFQTRPR